MESEIAALLPAIEADTRGRLAALEDDVDAVRRQRATLAARSEGTGPAVALQEDRTIPGPAGPIPVRVFIPEGRVSAAYLHIHGGGWVLGSERFQDPRLREIAARAGVAVISAGYRLAPEHPYPAPLDDCVAAANWLAASTDALGVADPAALAIGGESAGANLAAATLLRLREAGGPAYRAAVLTCGVFSAVYDLPSMVAMWDRPIVLSGPIMEYFTRCYVPAGVDPRDPLISPLYADLRGLPPAIFNVGTLDHLHSDSVLMAKAWFAAGNGGELHEYPDGPHGFENFPKLAMSRTCADRITGFLRRHVGSEAGAGVS